LALPIKGGLISEGILTEKRCQILPLSRKFEQVVLVKGWKSKLSAQGPDLALLVCNGTKVKIPSGIKQPLIYNKSRQE
jgi:hypothetical protein